MKLSIVIPAYNEIHTIEAILERVLTAPLPEAMEREVIVVDDFSKDGTRTWLEQYHSRFQEDRVKIYYHLVNQGKGAALRTGYSKCTGDIVIVQDADLEYDPNEYSKLLKPILLGKADVVFGSRFSGGEAHRVLYFWHMLANQFLTLCSNMLSDLNLTDMETCYKVYRKEVIDRITIEENRFGIEPEVTAKVAQQMRDYGISIYEVGISYSGRTYEEGKKIGFKDAIRALWCIFKYNNTTLSHLIKYAANGLIIFMTQFIVLIGLVELMGYKGQSIIPIELFGLNLSLTTESIAYAISIEMSFIVAFFLHSFISWNYRFKSIPHAFIKLVHFHLVSFGSFFVRQIVFTVLSLTGLFYLINALIGVAIAVSLNFLGYDRFVFKRMKKGMRISSPEALPLVGRGAENPTKK